MVDKPSIENKDDLDNATRACDQAVNAAVQLAQSGARIVSRDEIEGMLSACTSTISPDLFCASNDVKTKYENILGNAQIVHGILNVAGLNIKSGDTDYIPNIPNCNERNNER